MDAHLKASITLGSTSEALKAIEDLKRSQDAELMHLLKEREELVAKHERLKASHKASVDKTRLRAQAMHANHVHTVRKERKSFESEVSALGMEVDTPSTRHTPHTALKPSDAKRSSAAFQLHEIALKRSSQTMPVRSGGKPPHTGTPTGTPHTPHTPPVGSRSSSAHAAYNAHTTSQSSPVLHWVPQKDAIEMMVQAGAVHPSPTTGRSISTPHTSLYPPIPPLLPSLTQPPIPNPPYLQARTYITNVAQSKHSLLKRALSQHLQPD